jgi:hypothetical protein
MLEAMQTTLSQLRERSQAYPSGSPEREAFLHAIVRQENADQDERIDRIIMRSWRLTDAYKARRSEATDRVLAG